MGVSTQASKPKRGGEGGEDILVPLPWGTQGLMTCGWSHFNFSIFPSLPNISSVMVGSLHLAELCHLLPGIQGVPKPMFLGSQILGEGAGYV